jgi:hypothetical protein
MAQFLSHPETKQELTIYLASKTVSYFRVNTTAKKVNVTADTSTQNNQQETPQFHNQIKYCSYRQNKLPCTEICGCFVHECTNTTDNYNFEI